MVKNYKENEWEEYGEEQSCSILWTYAVEFDVGGISNDLFGAMNEQHIQYNASFWTKRGIVRNIIAKESDENGNKNTAIVKWIDQIIQISKGDVLQSDKMFQFCLVDQK